MSRSTEEQDSTKSSGRPEGLPKRWSAQRKAEVVLRLLRGEDIGEVSREIRGCAAGAGAVAAGVPGRGQEGAEGEAPAGRRADADPGEAGGNDDAGRLAGGRVYVTRSAPTPPPPTPAQTPYPPATA